MRAILRKHVIVLLCFSDLQMIPNCKDSEVIPHDLDPISCTSSHFEVKLELRDRRSMLNILHYER
jgi:hypothetical protein